MNNNSEAMRWRRFLRDQEDCIVARTNIGQVLVSTVCVRELGAGRQRIQVYETMCFRGPLDQQCVRYETREEAVAGHVSMVERVRQLLAAEEA